MNTLKVVVVSLMLLGAVLCQGPAPANPIVQANLYPGTSDGFDTVVLDDMSFVTELTIQSYTSTNVTYYVYGQSDLRTVFPGPNFYVGSTPIDAQSGKVPFIDFHTFQDSDGYVWGFGPIAPIHVPSALNPAAYSSLGIRYQLSVITDRAVGMQSFTFDLPQGVDGVFPSVNVVDFNTSHVIAYFAGFYNTNASNPAQIAFGVHRTQIQVDQFKLGNVNGTSFTFNNATDVATIYDSTMLIPYTAEFKPILLHLWNVNPADPTGTTYLVVVEPGFSTVSIVKGNVDTSIPLTVSPLQKYSPLFDSYGNQGRIVSAVSWQNLIFIGVAASGNASGWIDILDVSSPSLFNGYTFPLPPKYHNPQAMVLDYFSPSMVYPNIYVGCNGGEGLLKLDISGAAQGNIKILGYQALPFYLHRVRVGAPAKEHIYFATHEQRAKVFRVNKNDFCPANCPMFGFCKAGKCECDQQFDKKVENGQVVACEWHTLVVERTKEKRYHGGEIALGVFFTLSFLAAVAGWFMVYRSKRSGYQSVYNN